MVLLFGLLYRFLKENKFVVVILMVVRNKKIPDVRKRKGFKFTIKKLVTN